MKRTRRSEQSRPREADGRYRSGPHRAAAVSVALVAVDRGGRTSRLLPLPTRPRPNLGWGLGRLGGTPLKRSPTPLGNCNCLRQRPPRLKSRRQFGRSRTAAVFSFPSLLAKKPTQPLLLLLRLLRSLPYSPQHASACIPPPTRLIDDFPIPAPQLAGLWARRNRGRGTSDRGRATCWATSSPGSSCKLPPSLPPHERAGGVLVLFSPYVRTLATRADSGTDARRSPACRLLFGYAMPAFECFKTVEARPNDARMLRFWCQYW